MTILPDLKATNTSARYFEMLPCNIIHNDSAEIELLNQLECGVCSIFTVVGIKFSLRKILPRELMLQNSREIYMELI